MLAADKLQLQSAIKQQATALKEKEFNLHHSNLSTFIEQEHLVHVNVTCSMHSTRYHISSLSGALYLTLLPPLFTLHPSVTVGTQAAVLAGLDITMFIEFTPPDNSVWVSPKLYLLLMILLMLLSIAHRLCVLQLSTLPF